MNNTVGTYKSMPMELHCCEYLEDSYIGSKKKVNFEGTQVSS